MDREVRKTYKRRSKKCPKAERAEIHGDACAAIGLYLSHEHTDSEKRKRPCKTFPEEKEAELASRARGKGTF